MASLEETIRTALVNDTAVAALVGTAIYPNRIPPEESPTPWVYYTIPEEEPTAELVGAERKGQIEFELFAETYAECRRLKLALRAVLHGFRGGPVKRMLWLNADSSAVEGGHNITERYTFWAEAESLVPETALAWGDDVLTWSGEEITWGS